MALFRKDKKRIRVPSIKSKKQVDIPEDLLIVCPECKKANIREKIEDDYVCAHCSYHLHFPAAERVQWLTDVGTFEEMDGDLSVVDPLDFPDYDQKIDKAKAKTNLNESILTGVGEIGGVKTAIGVMEKNFIMASMGAGTGEKIVRLFERATEEELPLVLYIASGGARMQEGIMSLMQMAKVTQAISAHRKKGLFYLAVLTHPTTGGVTASFAMQGDITLAEPKATIGFAGKRVIEQTLKVKLDKDFQSAERTLENGFIDNIIDRKEQKKHIQFLVQIHDVNTELGGNTNEGNG